MYSFRSAYCLVLALLLAGPALTSQGPQTIQATTSALTNKDTRSEVLARTAFLSRMSFRRTTLDQRSSGPS
jgi:hypothetical protein